MASTLKDMGLESSRLRELFGVNAGAVCRVVFGNKAWNDSAFTRPDTAMVNDLRALEEIVGELEDAFPPVAEQAQKKARTRQVWGALVKTLKARDLYRHPEYDDARKAEQVGGDDMPPPMTDEELASLEAEADAMAGAEKRNSAPPAQEVTKPTRPVAKPFDPAEFEQSASHKADAALEAEVQKERAENPEAVDLTKLPPDEAFAIAIKTPDVDLEEQPGALAIKYDISRFSIARRRGHKVPPMEFLVPGLLPMGAVVVLAADGGLGKGMAELHLASMVAQKGIDLGAQWFGVNIVKHGKVVMFMAEDTTDDCQRRLQDSIGSDLPEDLYLMTFPDMGITEPLFIQSKDGAVTPSKSFYVIWEQLVAMRPALVVFDPVAPLADVDLDKDNRAASTVMKTIAALAQACGAAIIVAHHTSKQIKDNVSQDTVRATIRGATAIVNEARGAIVLYKAAEEFALSVCKALNEEFKPEKVLWRQLCKANFPGDMKRYILVRNDKGVLIDRTDEYYGEVRNTPDLMLEELQREIEAAAADGQPFCITGKAPTAPTLYNRRGELPEVFANIGRDKLENMARDLLKKKRIGRYSFGGAGRQCWLDVPGGAVARGDVTRFAPGARVRNSETGGVIKVPAQVGAEGSENNEGNSENEDITNLQKEVPRSA